MNTLPTYTPALAIGALVLILLADARCTVDSDLARLIVAGIVALGGYGIWKNHRPRS